MKKLAVIISVISLSLFFGCDAGSNSTTMSSESGGGGNPSTGVGQGGSMARFAITKDHLYVVSNENLNSYNVTNDANPVFRNIQKVGNGDLETVFPRENNLFIGSMNGMHIMDISNPGTPNFVSTYQHVVACDPVVADDRYAYVTLRSISNGRCFNNINQLEVIDLENLRSPRVINTINMVSPKGLGILGDKLFVCDDVLKMMDLTNRENPTFVKAFDGIEANDVIPFNDILIVTANDGIYQYQINGNEISLLSKIEVGA